MDYRESGSTFSRHTEAHNIDNSCKSQYLLIAYIGLPWEPDINFWTNIDKLTKNYQFNTQKLENNEKFARPVYPAPILGLGRFSFIYWRFACYCIIFSISVTNISTLL